MPQPVPMPVPFVPRPLPTHTIALTASPIGWWDGLWARKNGAAGCMERAAPASSGVLDALLSVLPALPTIATQALPIGWRDGARQRRSGAAGMLARVAHQQLAAVLESPVRLVSGVVERCWRPRHLPARSMRICSQPCWRLGVRQA